MHVWSCRVDRSKEWALRWLAKRDCVWSGAHGMGPIVIYLLPSVVQL